MAARERGRGRREEPREVQISKYMSYVLRHGAAKEGVKMDAGGWVEVDALLSLKKMASKKVSEEELKVVVTTNAKKRFALKEEDGVLFIRATQGHSLDSVKSANLLRKLTLDDLPNYPVVVHGTTRDNYKKIQESGGLSKMGRNHIHFAQGLPKDRVVSGMRNSSNLFIYLDTQKCLEDGLEVFVSENGVILLPGDERGFLDVKYFREVVEE
uniref:2'-phosphotransferase n=1 Tax=Paramoeba aestuarina TaxID=180227 RepID=A0A7S4KUD4_9EUKA|mmetsp:Transcript_25710/g.40078  ORF Transcript_25710/g.40078 Transcript_25710/m.40078 type:complete len:212 (+) Transcript_25710:154-789(+)|eukprot:CAMPEP_0201518870 /NCGR_PEP_ID=MMETSP0161_2-20130828/9592_1 /ASSEMBLY_ACC=CAM_ASM_000251 /TAXON_ID=180227 /ORGANISM="Neoparamoeba aestuarina, Strain SoJaBio B1-5/56/2" /LENGTH=211 /DNA_ID=CAMNT_0047916763 /DNA_START=181 /DNA_END=816 /DNA_ORIENTATION=+